jgi:hypothetical protein
MIRYKIEQPPNPKCLIFHFDKEIPKEYRGHSPWENGKAGDAFLRIPGVIEVFLGTGDRYSVMVTKAVMFTWDAIKPSFLTELEKLLGDKLTPVEMEVNDAD